MTDLHSELRGRLTEARQALVPEYEERTPLSKAAFERGCEVLPGGTTRSNLHLNPYPPTIAAATGATLTDLDSNTYVDLINDFAVAMNGHSNAAIRAAVKRQLDHGYGFGGRSEEETRLAELICKRLPSIERLRFANSGTEANLYAFLAARAFTGRKDLLMFEGGYHGGAMSAATKDDRLRAPFHFITVPYNDIAAFDAALAEHGENLAGVAMELMLNSGGCINADPAFVRHVAKRCQENGSLLIIDEVMTTRLAYGGLQSVYGVTPDLTSLGKMIGGGLTIGAFGGRADIMAQFDLRHPGAIQHNGSFNNNVLSMAAGIAALTDVLSAEAIEAVNRLGEALRDQLNRLFTETQTPLVASGYGSAMAIHIGREAPVRFAAPPLTKEIRSLFHLWQLVGGFWIAERCMIALSVETTEAHCTAFLDRTAAFVETHRGLLSDLNTTMHDQALSL